MQPCLSQVVAFKLRKLLREIKAGERAALLRYSQARPSQPLSSVELQQLIHRLRVEGRLDCGAVHAALPGEDAAGKSTAPLAVAALLECLLKQHQEAQEEDELCCPEPYTVLLSTLGCDHASDTSIIKHISAYEALVELVQQDQLAQLASVPALVRDTLAKDAHSLYLMLDNLQHAMSSAG